MSHCIKLFLCIFLFFCTIQCVADEPPKIGNFMLPTSQQPGPLLSLGQNIVDKNETQLALFSDNYVGVDKHFANVTPQVIYGLTDQLSLFVTAPYAASYKTGPEQSAGFEDATAQLEYVFHSGSTARFVDQATVVANITAPTGDAQKKPPTGVGSPSFLLATTWNFTSVNWLFFDSPGVVLTTDNNGTQFGNSYLYQVGFGRNIIARHGWIIDWIAEIDGTYAEKNKISGMTDPNSGGNVIYVTPSLWASTKTFTFQLGVGLPVSQNLYGNQTRDSYLLVANLGWSIY